MRCSLFVVVLGVGCGNVIDRSKVDASAPPIDTQVGDVLAIDAPADASLPNATFNSVLMFPMPNSVIRDFTATELAALGITGSGFNLCGGSETGNVDAPISGNCAAILSSTQMPLFTFATPIHAVGFSTDDIDYGNNNVVNIRVDGLDAASAVVATYSRPLQPAQSLAQENAGALFIGWRTSAAVTSVRVTIDQNNSTMLDNMVFTH